MLFGLRAGRGLVRDYARRGPGACDAGAPVPRGGRRVHCDTDSEQPGAAVARKRTHRSQCLGCRDHERAGRVCDGAWRSRRCDLLRGGEHNLFVSSAARTDDPRMARVVGRALVSRARPQRALPDCWLPHRSAGRISSGAAIGLPAFVFAPVFASWLLIKGVATPARRETR